MIAALRLLYANPVVEFWASGDNGRWARYLRRIGEVA